MRDVLKAIPCAAFMRRIALQGVAMLLIAAFLPALFVVNGHAASPNLILVEDLGASEGPDDDRLVPVPLLWEDDDLPVRFRLIREAGIVLQQDRLLGRDELKDFLAADRIGSEIRQALERAANEWNELEVSSFEFDETIGFSDFIFNPNPLELIPDRVRLDRYNVITFDNPDNAFSAFDAEENYAATIIFYAAEDFDASSGNDFLPPGAIAIVTPDETGEEDLLIDINGDSIEDMRLERKEYKAGEIIDADIIFNEAADFFSWPEDEGDLSGVEPAVTLEDVIGTPDIQTLATRQFGYSMGADSSLIPTSVMYNAYQTDVLFATDDDPETRPQVGDENPGQFFISPYTARDLSKQLDAQVVAGMLYPDDGLGSRGTISGIIWQGAEVESSSGDFDSQLPQVAVYAGRPVGSIDPNLAFPNDINSNRGIIRLETNVLSGLTQTINPGEQLGLIDPLVGDYSIPGLPPAGDYGIRIDDSTGLRYTGTAATLFSELFDSFSTGNDFIAVGTPEWYGGAGLNPTYDDGAPLDLADFEGDTEISTSYVFAFINPFGGVEMGVTNDILFSRIPAVGALTFKIVEEDGTVTEQTVFDETDATLGDVLVSDIDKVLITQFTVGGFLSVTLTYSIVDLQNNGQQDDLFVSVNVQNISNQNLTVSTRYLWDTRYGTVSNTDILTIDNEVVNDYHFVNGQLVLQETMLWPPPSTYQIRDNVSNTARSVLSFILDGFTGLTRPDKVIIASLFNLQLEDLTFDYVHQNGPFYDFLLEDGGAAPITANSVDLLYWNDRFITPGGSVTLNHAVGVTKFPRFPETGQAFDADSPDFLDDNPFVSEPVSVGAGGHTGGIDLITNDAPDRVDPPGTTPGDGGTGPGGIDPPGTPPTPADDPPDFDDGNQPSNILPLETLVAFGAATGDIDNDGDLDIFLAVGARSSDPEDDVFGAGLGNRLYRNLLKESGTAQFVDITFGVDEIPDSSVGNDDRIPFQQDASFDAVFADFDNDGDQDIFVSNFAGPSLEVPIPGRQNRLYLNRGGLQGGEIGFFDNVTEDVLPGILNVGPNNIYSSSFVGVLVAEGNIQSGATFDISTRSAVGDIDGDGDIDIVVSNANLMFDPASNVAVWEPSLPEEIGDTPPDNLDIVNLGFSERILINTTVDIERVTGEPTSLNGTLRFFDETLGGRTLATSVWGGSFAAPLDTEVNDRVPPTYPNLFGNDGDPPIPSIGTNDSEVSDTAMVYLASLDNSNTGFDVYIGNRRPLGAPLFGVGGGTFQGVTGAHAGQDVIWQNQDIDLDGVPDGYFEDITGGSESLTFRVNQFPTYPQFTRSVAIYEGDNGDIPNPEFDYMRQRLGDTQMVLAFDPGYRGQANPYVVTIQTPVGSGSGLQPPFLLESPTNIGFSRRTGTVGSNSNAYVPADGVYPSVASSPVLETVDTPDNNSFIAGRPRAGAVADFNLDGDHDVLVASDTITTTGIPDGNVQGDGIIQYLDNSGAVFTALGPMLVELSDDVDVGAGAAGLVGGFSYLEAADFDNDGDSDVLALTRGTGIRVIFNEGTISPAELVPNIFSDTDFPLFFDKSIDYLYPLASIAIFPEIAADFPGSSITTGAAFADVNSDGLIDLAVSAGAEFSIIGDFNRFYLNMGNQPYNSGHKIFKPAVGSHPGPRMFNAFDGFTTGQIQPTSHVELKDLTGDGIPDMFATNVGSANQLYINIDDDDESVNSRPDDDDVADGVFINQTTALLPNLLSIDADLELSNHFAIANFDIGQGNNLPDIFIANGGPRVQNVLFRNVPPIGIPNATGGAFVNVTDTNLPSLEDDTAHVVASDFDGDGDIDIFVLNRYRPSGPFSPRSRLYFNNGDGTFEDVTFGPDGIADNADDRLPLITGQVTSAVAADFDLAGDITEDLNGNGLLDANELEFLTKNGIIDSAVLPNETEDTNGNGILDVGEDVGILVPAGIVVDSQDAVLVGVGDGILTEFDVDGNGTIDRRNGAFQSSYDIFITRNASGSDNATNLLLINDGAGNFSFSPNLPSIADNSYAVDTGNITLRTINSVLIPSSDPGTFQIRQRPLIDIIVGNDELGGSDNSITFLVNDRNSPGTFIDRSVEIPIVTSTLTGDTDPVVGNIREVRLADVDTDGDLDLFLGQVGRFTGVFHIGATDWMLINRVIPDNLLSQTAQGNSPGLLPVPVISRVTPARAEPGATVTAMVNGKNFENGASLNFGDGTEVIDYEIVQPTAMLVKLRIAPNAELGPRTVKVKVPSGLSADAAGLFQVGTLGTPVSASWLDYE